jgi:predicted nucleotidyltransferase
VALYIFGSYAWGLPTDESDIDVLVVVEESDRKPYQRAREGLRALRGLGLPKDIVVYTKKEFSTLSEEAGSLLQRVRKEGVRLA